MNKNQIIQIEQNKINAIRTHHLLEVNGALAEARNNLEYKDIDNKIRKLELSASKLDENSPEIADIHKKIATLQKKGANILKKAGFDANRLIPHFNCAKCQDTGYVQDVMCDCLKKGVQKALLEQSGINNKLNYDFSKADKEILKEYPLLSKIYKFAYKYCQDFPNNKEPNLIFSGDVGTGKTFLLECIANELMKKLVYVVFTTAYDISRTMIKAFNSPYSDRDAILSPLFESDVLIIDDLGTEPLFHDSTLTNFFTLINERQRNRLPIIISTNLTPDQINERYGDRIKSRLFDARTTMSIRFESADLRLRK